MNDLKDLPSGVVVDLAWVDEEEVVIPRAPRQRRRFSREARRAVVQGLGSDPRPSPGDEDGDPRRLGARGGASRDEGEITPPRWQLWL